MLTHFCTALQWERLWTRTVHELCDWNKSSFQQSLSQTSTPVPWPTCRHSALLLIQGCSWLWNTPDSQKIPNNPYNAIQALVNNKGPYHFIVLLRLGWLTVLSSINIVEHELYFFVSCPGETLGEKKKKEERRKELKYIQAERFCKLSFSTLNTGFTPQVVTAQEVTVDGCCCNVSYHVAI